MAPKFQGVDFYDADGLLTEEERAVRDTVRQWVDEHVIPVIGEHYVAGKFPAHLVPQMAELGLFGANLPEEYGCAGLNNVAYGLIMQELERGDSGVRSFASVQGALVMYPIYEFGSDEQKRRWLPELAAGRAIGCFGLTEPDYGSNPAGMITVAKQTKDGWVLNGAKMWITNGSTADVAIVWAKIGRLDDPGSIRGFIVPTETKGFTAKDQQGKLSLRASDTSELVLQDVALPGDALLPNSCSRRGSPRCSPRSPRRSCSASSSGASRIRGRSRRSRCRLPSATTSAWRPTWRARRGGCSGRTASSPSIRRCATSRTSSRSTPTRARTTSIR